MEKINKVNLVALCMMFLIISCGKKEIEKVRKPVKEESNVIEVNNDDVIEPSGKEKTIQIYAEKSVPLNSGALADIVIENNKVIVQGAKVINVKWKVPGPFQMPKYPASGFVSISVFENQIKAIENAKTISIRPSKKKDS